eukprot:777847-Pleurochrysis_carterae.AAC.1
MVSSFWSPRGSGREGASRPRQTVNCAWGGGTAGGGTAGVRGALRSAQRSEENARATAAVRANREAAQEFFAKAQELIDTLEPDTPEDVRERALQRAQHFATRAAQLDPSANYCHSADAIRSAAVMLNQRSRCSSSTAANTRSYTTNPSARSANGNNGGAVGSDGHGRSDTTGRTAGRAPPHTSAAVRGVRDAVNGSRVEGKSDVRPTHSPAGVHSAFYSGVPLREGSAEQRAVLAEAEQLLAAADERELILRQAGRGRACAQQLRAQRRVADEQGGLGLTRGAGHERGYPAGR